MTVNGIPAVVAQDADVTKIRINGTPSGDNITYPEVVYSNKKFTVTAKGAVTNGAAGTKVDTYNVTFQVKMGNKTYNGKFQVEIQPEATPAASSVTAVNGIKTGAAKLVGVKIATITPDTTGSKPAFGDYETPAVVKQKSGATDITGKVNNIKVVKTTGANTWDVVADVDQNTAGDIDLVVTLTAKGHSPKANNAATLTLSQS